MGYTYEGCFSDSPTPSDGQLYSAPAGETMDANVCTQICVANGNTIFSIVYDTDFCLCTNTLDHVVSDNGCFQPCSGTIPSPGDQCGAANRGVVFQLEGAVSKVFHFPMSTFARLLVSEGHQ